MFGDFKYVVKFSNGKYYAGEIFTEKEVDDLSHAVKYVFHWQPMKDTWLRFYCDEEKLSYEIIEVKITTTYEIV